MSRIFNQASLRGRPPSNWKCGRKCRIRESYLLSNKIPPMILPPPPPSKSSECVWLSSQSSILGRNFNFYYWQFYYWLLGRSIRKFDTKNLKKYLVLLLDSSTYLRRHTRIVTRHTRVRVTLFTEIVLRRNSNFYYYQFYYWLLGRSIRKFGAKNLKKYLVRIDNDTRGLSQDTRVRVTLISVLYPWKKFQFLLLTILLLIAWTIN